MNLQKVLKNITDFLITSIILILVQIIKPLNNKLRTKIGKLFGKTIYIISKKRREITRDNLRKAFPEKDAEWIEDVTIRSFENLGIVFAEIFWLKSATKEQIQKFAKYNDINLFNETLNRGQGLIVLSAHFGNWELMALSGGLVFDVPFTIIVKPQSNKFLDKYINQIRTKFNNKVIDMYHSSFELIKLIKNKGNLALLADQSAISDKDIYVEFFGRKALTFDAPAQLALKFKIPILMSFALRQTDGTYEIHYFELDHSDLTNTPEDVAKLTKRHTQILEEMIRKYPDHWVWQHRRWKHTID